MIETKVDPDASIHLTPLGDLDWIGATSLRHAVYDALSPGITLLIDLSRVGHVDAVGLSALVGSVRRVRAVGGEVQVLNPRPRVRRRLEVAGVYHILLRSTRHPGDDAA